MGDRSHVLFPHADQDGPCDYEIKSRGFTGFAPGGEKRLRVSEFKRTEMAVA